MTRILASEPLARARPGGGRQRDRARPIPKRSALLASPIPYLSMPEALWHFFLKRPPRADGRRDARQDDLDRDDGARARTRPGAIPRCWSAASRTISARTTGSAAGERFRHRRRRVRHRVLRQGPEVPPLPRPRRDHHRGRVRSRRHLPRPGSREIELSRAGRAAWTASRVLAVCADFPHALEVSAAARARRLTFGLREGEFRAAEITRRRRRRAIFELTRDGDRSRLDLICRSAGE